MKWLIVVFILCGEPVGIVTNNEALATKYRNPDAEVVLPLREEIEIAPIRLEELTGLMCV